MSRAPSSTAAARHRVAACMLLAVLIAGAATPSSARGRSWHQHASRDRGPVDAMSWHLDTIEGSSRLQLTFEMTYRGGGRNVNSDDIAPEQISGFDRSLFSAEKRMVTLTLKRDAGTFTLSGFFDRGHGLGTFTFDADPGFARELERRDIGRPDAEQQLELAISDCSVAFLDVLRDNGTRGFDVAALIQMEWHGVNQEFVTGMARAGHRLVEVDEMIATRDHGVDPQYVAEMKQAGFGAVSSAELVQARDHGVDGDFASELADLGYTHLELAELIQARDHGVDGHFARRVQARYGKDVPLRRVIELRDRGFPRD